MVAVALGAIPAAQALKAGPADDANPSRYDATPPTLTVDPLQFQIGKSIDVTTTGVDGCAKAAWHYAIPLQLSWKATDDVSGVKAYDILSAERGDTLDTQATSLQAVGSDYWGDCGGGDFNDQWAIAAKDNRGNLALSSWSSMDKVKVTQEDGLGRGAATDGNGQFVMTKTAGWSISKCACYDGGTTLYSTVKNQSITYAVTTEGPGQTFAVVMEKNTNRGKASITVNGGKATTVDTYASPAQHAAIVWQATLPAGTSKVTVKNLGTASRTRIDVDALMLTSPPQGGVSITYPDS